MKSDIIVTEMDLETERSFSRMAYGHEMWIEGLKLKDGMFSLYGLYGHKLLPDKPMPTDYANPVLYDDDKRVEDPYRDIVNEPRGWEFEFEDKGAKVYTFYIDSCSTWVTDDEGWHRGSKRDFDKVSYSGSFHMTAKKIISRNKKDVGDVRHAELEIVPSEATLYKGKKAEIEVSYEGKPLPDHKVIVYCRGWQDLQTMKTDSDGKLRFDVTDKGTYIFITKYTDTSKSESEDFDETVYSSTLSMEAE